MLLLNIFLYLCIVTIVLTDSTYDDIRNLDDEKIDIDTYCKEIKCISKCCRNKELYDDVSKSCVVYNETLDFSQNTYKINNEISNVKISDLKFIMNLKFSKKKCNVSMHSFATWNSFAKVYLWENGLIGIEEPSSKEVSELSIKNYCIDYMIQASNGTPELGLMVVNVQQEDLSTSVITQQVSLSVSIFFLAIAFTIYSVLPEMKEKLYDLIQWAYVGTLLVAYCSKLAALTTSPTSSVLAIRSILVYYSFISLFFWMKIMSYDIWWAFRALFKHRNVNRKGILNKFMWYSIYAWGTPFLLTFTLVIVYVTDLGKYTNAVVLNFSRGLVVERSTIYYFYLPIFILISFNCLFYALTVFNIWRVDKSIKDLTPRDAAKNKNNRNRFVIYIQMFCIMGISWILDVVSAIWRPPYELMLCIDMYNIFTGVAIFFITVFKKRVLKALFKRYPVHWPWLNKYLGIDSKTNTSMSSKRSRSQITNASFSKTESDRITETAL